MVFNCLMPKARETIYITSMSRLGSQTGLPSEYSQIMITPRLRVEPDPIKDGGRGIYRHRISLTLGLCRFSGNRKRYFMFCIA